MIDLWGEGGVLRAIDRPKCFYCYCVVEVFIDISHYRYYHTVLVSIRWYTCLGGKCVILPMETHGKMD